MLWLHPFVNDTHPIPGQIIQLNRLGHALSEGIQSLFYHLFPPIKTIIDSLLKTEGHALV